MAKEVPQKKTFDYVVHLNSIGSWLIWIIFTLSLVPLFIPVDKDFYLLESLEWILLILIPIEFIISIIKTHYLMPKAERERRYDALDNAFGSNFSFQNSKEYFTNEEIPEGVFKFGVNLFQNVFFTTQLSSKMMMGFILRSSVFGSVFIIMAVYGLKNSPIMLPVLQFLFSASVFGDLIKFLLYHKENSRILEELKTAFHSSPSESIILKEYLDYETNISWGQVLISDRVFNKYNKTLEGEWQKIKLKYKLNGK